MGSVKSFTRTIFLPIDCEAQLLDGKDKRVPRSNYRVFKRVHRWPQMSGSEPATIGFARFMRPF
jgi:hypothetical protein